MSLRRYMSRRGLRRAEAGKTIFVGAVTTFCGQMPTANNEKIIIIFYFYKKT